jgi:hypothetical protein
VLRREVRKRVGKAETPTACIIDSQSVKTSHRAAVPRGQKGEPWLRCG